MVRVSSSLSDLVGFSCTRIVGDVERLMHAYNMQSAAQGVTGDMLLRILHCCGGGL